MKAYAETGFIVSLYKEETTSAKAISAINEVGIPVLLSELSLLEFRNAMNLAVFRKEITRNTADRIWQHFKDDVAQGIFCNIPVPASKLYSESNELSDKYTDSLGTRSLDLMHVAFALLLGAEIFLSFDIRQRSAAETEGLKVLPPHPSGSSKRS